MHRADEASLKLLRFLVGDLAHQPVRLGCAWRDQEALRGELRAPTGDLAVGTTWQLGGLDAHETAALITASSGLVVADDDALAVRERSQAWARPRTPTWGSSLPLSGAVGSPVSR